MRFKWQGTKYARYPRVTTAFILPLGSVNCKNVVYSPDALQAYQVHSSSPSPLPLSQVQSSTSSAHTY